jgi:hypothetical protein
MILRFRTSAAAIGLAMMATGYAQYPIPRIPTSVFAKLRPAPTPVLSLPKIDVKPANQSTEVKAQPGDPAHPSAPNPEPAPTKRKNSTAQWFNDMVSNRIDFSGRRVLSYHQHAVTGDTDAFSTTNYYGQGDRRFTNSGQMNITGKKVAGVVDFNFTIIDDRIQNLDERRLTATYNRGPATIAVGDLNGSLVNSNRFARLNRTVNGAQIGWKSGRTEAKALRSETRGSARTVTAQGNNSVGPYYLQGGRIRPDTLQVMVDGERQRLGDDFELDTEIGAITFISRVISPTNTIVATYESSAFNESSGVLQGVGMTYDFGRTGRVGLTAMEQVGKGAASTSSKVELFQGRGSPGVGYDLDYDPVPATVVLRVGGIIQVPVADFYFDPKYPRRFYMTRYIDPSQTINVTYQPVGIVSVDGDRRTYGVDYRIPFGKTGDRGYLQLNTAVGGFIGGDSGQAKGFDLEQRERNWTFKTSFRDIPRDYVSVESRGFDRNEQAHDWSAEYSGNRTSYGISGSNSSVFIRNSTNNSYSTARYTSVKGSLKYSDPDGTNYSLDHTRVANHYQDDSRIDTTSVTGRRRFGRVDASIGLQYQTGEAPITKDNVTEVGPLRVASIVGTADWNAGQGLSLGTRLSLNDIKALDEQGKGYDASLRVGWRPSDIWSVGAQYAQSDSGDLPAISVDTGYGAGYNGGNGFTSGSTGDQLLIGASSLKRVALATEYRANERLTVNARWQQYRAFGDLSANADNRTYGIGATYDLGRSTYLSGSVDRSMTTYQGTNGDSQATTFSASVSASPPGRFSFNFGITGLISQSVSSSVYSQDSLSYDVSVGYRIANRQRLNFAFSRGSSTGYYGQDDSFTSLSYDYQLYRNIALRTGYTWRNVANLDPSVTSGSYRSNGIDVELIFDF